MYKRCYLVFKIIRSRTISNFLFLISFLFFGLQFNKIIAGDLGPADFPGDFEHVGLKSIHKASCKQLKRTCQITFEGDTMRVDNFRGIRRDQFIDFKTAFDRNEQYFYVTYKNSAGKKTTALFLFVNRKAAGYFGQALSKWYEMDPRPIPKTY